MSEIKSYFDGITTAKSTEDIAKNVMAAEKRTESSRMRFKPFAVAAAAAVVLVGGVTAAAATGLIDFNEIFGGRITTQDEQLAGALVGAAHDFSWTVSDDDYMIELKGITGSKSDMLLVYEIARTDGKPVTDFMTNIPEDGRLEGFIGIEFSDESTIGIKDSNQFIVNEQGNIEVYNRMITDGDISGQRYSTEVVNLYPKNIMNDFLTEQDSGAFMWRHLTEVPPIGFYNEEAWAEGKPMDIALDDERIIGLELTWSVDFTYTPSETAILSKSISDEGVTMTINRKSNLGDEAEPLDCTLTDSHFSCVGGWLEFEYEGEIMSFASADGCNEVHLLMADGSQIPCVYIGFVNITFHNDDPVTTTIKAEIRYSETLDDPIKAIDISEITAISINGEIFSLA